MNILVLGNGFDLALGLPTKYTDFLEFVNVIEELCPNEYLTERCINNAYSYAFSGMSEKKYDAFVNQLGWAFHSSNHPCIAIQDMYDCIHENAWINYFQRRISENQISGENWIDLEKEIKNVVQILDRVSYDIRYLGDIMDTWARTMNRTPLDIDGILHDFEHNRYSITLSRETYIMFKSKLRGDFERFVCALQIYFDFFVGLSKLVDGRQLPSPLKALHFDNVLSFNYTPYWNKLNKGQIGEQQICFVHGKLSYCNEKNDHKLADIIQNSDVIIGFDEYLDNNKKNEQLEFVYYRKYFQRIAKGTGSEYLSWLSAYQYDEPTQRYSDETIAREAARYPNHVYIFGHSMDPTDKDIFKDIFLREPNDTKVTIYYHDEEAHERIITNLIAIIGQDRLIEKTHKRGFETADIEIVPQFDFLS